MPRYLLAMLVLSLALGTAHADPATHHPELAELGRSFRIALLADPQVGRDGTQNPVGANAEKTLSEAVAELNAMEPKPAFAVFVGDLVNTFEPGSVENFEKRIQPLDMTTVLVHGNHDTRPPYEPFLDLQQRVNGVRAPFYSFNAGPWHCVVLPCNLEGNSPEATAMREAMFTWLDEDLNAHRDRPTMVFEHLHLMPQGLTQTEWYTFELPSRKRLVDRLTRDGNVKYVFHGHVHNGIRVSEKASWSYRGTNFVNVPTITASRPFGEKEVPGFELAADRAGYYMLADVSDAAVTLTGRAAGVAAPYTYPATFQAFDERVEPRWFKTIPELPAHDLFLNGGFESGLSDWQKVYRYKADVSPGFIAESQRKHVSEGEEAAFIQTASRGEVWANDESNEIYQITAVPAGSPVHVAASILLPERYQSGGGFVRVEVIRDAELLFLLMAHWGEHESKADYFPRAVGFGLHGTQQGWRFFQELGEQKRGLYVPLHVEAEHWHKLDLNLASFYDAALQTPGAYAALQANKVNLAVGTWCNKEAGSQSRACFDAIQVEACDADHPSTFDASPLLPGAGVFSINFAQDLVDRQARQAERNARKQAKDKVQ